MKDDKIRGLTLEAETQSLSHSIAVATLHSRAQSLTWLALTQSAHSRRLVIKPSAQVCEHFVDTNALWETNFDKDKSQVALRSDKLKRISDIEEEGNKEGFNCPRKN
ncbi:hypothetical protein TorRG33x02_182330 [Trema orientale]|uniref:Uncharacterized protein n=1 Tax=Trema orientale TaxID=63057 RepID=A0A2P5EKD4_TREOI|nr:hypothetical protein TorRG33x02_182330 [Trema orientale]